MKSQFQFAEPCNAPGEPDYEMLWRREQGLRLAAPPGARKIGIYLYSGIQALDNKAPI